MTSRQFTTSKIMEQRVAKAMEGKPPPMRKMGLLVPEEQRMRVDGFVHILPKGMQRRLALSVVTDIRAKHDNFTDEEYFSELAKEVLGQRILEHGIVDRIMSMPVSQRGNAFRVALNRKASDRSQYSELEFYGNLVSDAKENVPGEKQEEILAKMSRHVRDAHFRGTFNRESVNAVLYPFEEWLRKADAGSVNLLYYFIDRVDRMMETALAAHFTEFRRVVQEGLPKIAEFDSLGGKVPGMRVHYLDYAVDDFRRGGLGGCSAMKECAGQR